MQVNVITTIILHLSSLEDDIHIRYSLKYCERALSSRVSATEDMLED